MLLLSVAARGLAHLQFILHQSFFRSADVMHFPFSSCRVLVAGGPVFFGMLTIELLMGETR